jgi:hypothetical protein
MKQKPNLLFFPDMKTESKAETEEGTEVATPPGGTGSQPGVGPSGASDIAPPPINCLRHENPK